MSEEEEYSYDEEEEERKPIIKTKFEIILYQCSDYGIILALTAQFIISKYISKWVGAAIATAIIYLFRTHDLLLLPYNYLILFSLYNSSANILTSFFFFVCLTNLTCAMYKNNVLTYYYGIVLSLHLAAEIKSSNFLNLCLASFIAIGPVVFIRDTSNYHIDMSVYSPIVATLISLLLGKRVLIESIVLMYCCLINKMPSSFIKMKYPYRARMFSIPLLLEICVLVYEFKCAYLTKSSILFHDTIHYFFHIMYYLMAILHRIFYNKEISKKYSYGFSRVRTIGRFAEALAYTLIGVSHIGLSIYYGSLPRRIGGNGLIKFSLIRIVLYLIGGFFVEHCSHFTTALIGNLGIIAASILTDYFDFSQIEFIIEAIIGIVYLYIGLPEVFDAADSLLVKADPGPLNGVKQALSEGVDIISTNSFTLEDGGSVLTAKLLGKDRWLGDADVFVKDVVKSERFTDLSFELLMTEEANQELIDEARRYEEYIINKNTPEQRMPRAYQL